MIELEFQNWNRVQNGLRALATENRNVTDKRMGKWAQETRAYLKSYPYPSQTNNPQPFKTDKQRKWFFWALGTGVIQVPYKRTGRFANSWRGERKGESEWVVGNSAPYAGLLAGRGTQAKYHEGNWPIYQELVEARTGELTDGITEDLMSFAQSQIGGVP